VAERGLPDLVLGVAPDNPGKQIAISSRHRSRGIAVVGQPGTGKSTLNNALCLQDIKANKPVFYMEPHEGIINLLPLIPEHRRKDVVLLTFRTDASPLWPVLDVARTDDEMPLMGGLLVDSWRAQYGQESIGPRAASILRHALSTLPRVLGASPLELVAVLNSASYRQGLLQFADLIGKNYALSLYWNESIRRLGEARLQDWAQAVANKLDPLLDIEWLRLATCGVPALSASYSDILHPFKDIARTPVEVLWKDPEITGLKSVTWLRDGILSLRFEGQETSQICMFDDELERFFVTYRDGHTIYSEHHRQGFQVDSEDYPVDHGDPFIALPSQSEVDEFGQNVRADVDRRRRRRGWNRLVDTVLMPAGIRVREAIDIGDQLDDGKIVLVEVPEIYGEEVTVLTATFAFLSAVLRGHRQLSLPPSRRVPCAIYIDEAALFLSEGIERVLAELRKADVGLTIDLQRLGQLGRADSTFRRGVIDTIGTIITLPVGIQEVDDVAKMFDCDKKIVLELSRGEGLVYTLTGKGALQGSPTPFVFERPPDSFSADQLESAVKIRKMSIDRYYQSRESAEEVFRQRVVNIDNVRRQMAREEDKKQLRGPRARGNESDSSATGENAIGSDNLMSPVINDVK
jgi:GTPase SAR1 family protein